MYEIIEISSNEEFYKYYQKFKELSSIKSNETKSGGDKINSSVENNNNRFVIGLDIEYISKTNYPKSYKSLVEKICKYDKNMKDKNISFKNVIPCLIQLCTKELCLVIKLNSPRFLKDNNGSIPVKLKEIIKNASWIKYGIGISNDLRILSNRYGLGQCNGGIEIENILLMSKMVYPNLDNAYEKIINKDIKKSELNKPKTKLYSLIDWSKEKLSEDEIKYAAIDSKKSYELGIEIMKPSINKLKEINEINDKSSINDTSFINVINDNEDESMISNFERELKNILREYNSENNKTSESCKKSETCTKSSISELNEIIISKFKGKIYPIYEAKKHENEWKIECIVNDKSSFNLKSIGCNKLKKNAKEEASKKMILLIKDKEIDIKR